MASDNEPSSSIGPANSSAGVSSMAHLTHEEMRSRMGYVPGPDEPSLDQRERISREVYERTRDRRDVGEAKFPAQWDWRSKDGRSFVSPVKDQGNCGTCVAFAANATTDAMMRIDMNLATGDPSGGLMPDLSEAQMFYCGGLGDCTAGGQIGPAMDYAKSTGLVAEASYPYRDRNTRCRISLVKNWQNLITKISGHKIFKLAEGGSGPMKDWISTRGPLVAVLKVYQDFKDFRGGGVYKWNGTSPRIDPDGKDVGHAVCVIGYDEKLQAWLCKNSWGTGWGNGGYGYIAYGDCGIDAEMWGVEGISTIYPFVKATGKPSICVYNSGMHYCYRDTNNNIQDVVWNGRNWTATQVTGPYGQTYGPQAAGDPAVIVYRNDVDADEIHCFYRDSDGYIWDAVLSAGQWSAMQVTGAPGLAHGGPTAASDLTPVVYDGTGFNQLHCCYGDGIGFLIWGAVLSGGIWSIENVSGLSGNQLAIGNLSVVVYSGTGFNQMHYSCRDQNSNICDVVYDDNGKTWSKQQVAGPGGKTNGPKAAGNPAVVVFSGTGFNQMHYCYRDGESKIWDAVYSHDGGSWAVQQVAGPGDATNGPAAAGDPAVIVYSGTGFNQMHYCYRDKQGNIWDANYDDYGKHWSVQQITGSGGQTDGPAAASDPMLVVYSGAGFNQMHCCYRDTTGYLQDVVWDANTKHWSRQII